MEVFRRIPFSLYSLCVHHTCCVHSLSVLCASSSVLCALIVCFFVYLLFVFHPFFKCSSFVHCSFSIHFGCASRFVHTYLHTLSGNAPQLKYRTMVRTIACDHHQILPPIISRRTHYIHVFKVYHISLNTVQRYRCSQCGHSRTSF